ncbi:MAG TPA: LLM class flavin-dependent oxidoreductase [Ktedonosporobacter sp.]|nr:LLM class flavin-dependent oxidoreductase [Ktedonosporobacter sp.]
MHIGVGLPSAIPTVKSEFILDWARKAESGPFSSLSVLDRIVYPSYDPLITLAAAAGVTQRIRLMTTVLLAPLHSAAALAKQAASLDALSGGRLTLGLGVGGREDDFEAMEAPLHRRGKRFDRQLATMARLWSGEHFSETAGPIGPAPVQEGGPEVLIGGYTEAALKRVGHWNQGYIAGAFPPPFVPHFFQLAEKSWLEAGRSGKPRLIACSYYGLGPDATERTISYITHFYSFLGPMAQMMANAVPTTPEAVRTLIDTYKDMNADELILWPCIPELDQLSRLEELVAGSVTSPTM